MFCLHGIYFLLCRDISLAAEVFFLNRSKCQVWLSQQAQGTAKGLALNFITQVNLAHFWEEKRVETVMGIMEPENICEGSAVKYPLYKGNLKFRIVGTEGTGVCCLQYYMHTYNDNIQVL